MDHDVDTDIISSSSPGGTTVAKSETLDVSRTATTVSSSAEPLIEAVVAKDEPVVEISKNTHIFYIVTFILLGNASLYFWNALLNCIFDVMAQQYPTYDGMSDTLTAVNNTLCFCTSVVVLFFGGSLHRWMMYTGYVTLAICSIAFCLIVQYVDGQTGFILHHVLQVFAGIGAGLAEAGSFSFACVLPRIYAGWVSFGMGVSGILSFAIYMLFSETVFKGEVENDVWVNLGVSAFLSFAAVVILFFFFRDPIAKASVEKVQAQIKMKSDVENEAEQPITYWQAFKSTWRMQLNTGFVMWLTLFLFPNVGPLAWGDPSSQTNTVMGMFQLGDFCGRYIPNMASVLPLVMISEKWLPWLTLVRLAFIAVFVASKEITTGIMGNFGVHIVLMLTLAISNGWYVTLSLIYIPRTLERQCDRNKASSLGVIFLLFGIMAGLWMAKIFGTF